MFRNVVRVSDNVLRLVGNRMRDPKAEALNKLPKFPVADAAIAMAFALRKDGQLNLPTQSIVKNTVQLYRNGLARKLIFFGSGQANNTTEADAMTREAKKLGVEDEVISEVEKLSEVLAVSGFRQDLAVKELDMVLLGQELKRLGAESSYLVAHPLHLRRARMLCENKFPEVTFYPIEAERLYDWESNQVRCRAETLFIFWNNLAFVEHFITGKIRLGYKQD